MFLLLFVLNFLFLSFSRLFQVDIAYIPFIERFQIVLNELFKCDITAGRPKLSAWIQVYTYKQSFVKSEKIILLFIRDWY